MTTQTAQLATTSTIECPECAGAVPATASLPGEILDCPDCGAELELRSVNPPVVALAPQAEEDWGE
jgi:alpha-aminoadipate carrier protein LysW